jgi:hypothetical protein
MIVRVAENGGVGDHYGRNAGPREGPVIRPVDPGDEARSNAADGWERRVLRNAPAARCSKSREPGMPTKVTKSARSR